MFFTVIFVLFLSGFSNSINVNVSVDTTKPIRTVSDKFLSVTLDISLLMYEWKVLNFTHITPLTSALGPGYLRFGGTHADSTMFYENPSTNTSFEHGKVVFSAKDLGQLYDFVNYTGWRLIMDINQQIFNEGTHVWNSSNAKSFLDYASSKQYSMDFELGNEPDLYASHGMGVLNGSEIAENYKLFKQLLDGYDLYKGSIIMGPSTTANGEHLNGTSLEILKDFIASGGDQAVYAINIHHYYFRGETATWGDFIEPKRLNGYKDVIQILQSINIHNKTLFNGESSSAYDGGAPNLSDTYLAGFIWLDKLGVGATFGMDAIMRQDIWGGNYGLLNGSQDPLPDYWLSLLYKKLVGETVYGVRIEGGDQYLRLYAASNRNSDGVVVYGEILSNASVTLNFPDFSNFDATLYLLKEGEPGNLTSKTSRLNGQPLSWMSHEPIVSIQGQPVTFPLEIPAYSQIFITLQPKSSQGCPSGWTQLSTVKNKCVKVVQDFKQPWFGARLDCNTFGVNSTLLSIDNAFENSEIQQKSTSSGCDKLFIDLYRNGNAWTWSNGDQGGYRNFETGYPNADPTQNCVAFDASTGGWKNIDCDLSNCFICQQYIP